MEMVGSVSVESMDLDLVREFLLGDWQEPSDCLDELGPEASSTGENRSSGWIGTGLEELKDGNRDDRECAQANLIGCFYGNPSLDSSGGTSVEQTSLVFGSDHEGRSLGYGPIGDRSYASSIRERLSCALSHVRESNARGEILIQIWMPVRMGNRLVLSTSGLPFSLDSNCQRLVNYRKVSMQFQFSAEANSEHALGLPGRVFVGELPEWTPDVRFFHSYEYPRVGHAQLCDVRGSIALPVFEREGRSCLGVVEVVMVTEQINYCSDLDNICTALQAVNLRSTGTFNIFYAKVKNHDFQAALPEISNVLRIACEEHKLPLAQVWIPCVQQGKGGSRHTVENYKNCISTADCACYINDSHVMGFQEACSEHHLFKGQGVAGKAFATNQPCFMSDVSASNRTEYPLSHIARLFNLHGAVAIRLRSFNAGTTDFILEFFLPVECVSSEEQKAVLYSLSCSIRQVCQSLRAVTPAELEVEGGNVEFQETVYPTENEVLAEFPRDATSTLNSRGTLNMSMVQKIDQISFSADAPNAEQEFSGIYAESHWNEEADLPVHHLFSKVNPQQQNLVHGTNHDEYSVTLDNESLKTKTTSEKKRAKGEKAISLEVLQQYFCGSLKDAATVLGVCPTTLKRICRQHGITRWPSRKFKKVSHSLKKLQSVIDSVEGVDKSYQFSSLYENAPHPLMLGSEVRHSPGDRKFSTLKQFSLPETSDAAIVYNTSTSDSPSSSCSRNSTSMSHSSSGGTSSGNANKFTQKERAKYGQNVAFVTGKVETGLQALSEGPSLVGGYFDQKPVAMPPSGTQSSLAQNSRPGDTLGIKATFGDDKVRFKLQPGWSLHDLKQEIAKRFSIAVPSLVELKYLDDDSERMLLTCDADFLECINVYRSSGTRTIKIFARIAEP